MVELNVLVAMALGMTLEQLIDIYTIEFPVLYKNEKNTWYDLKGRTVFSTRSLGNLIYKHSEFEKIKDAAPGEKFYREIEDDTMPGGPIKRTIEYVAPYEGNNMLPSILVFKKRLSFNINKSIYY